MASIDRTAYPRFQTTLSAPELHTLYAPTEAERHFVALHAREAPQQLTLLTLLKGHQVLGYLPQCAAIPAYVPPYLRQHLHLPPETGFHDTPSARARYRQLIRGYLDVHAYAAGGARLVAETVTQAAYTMSDPADLINVAIEQLIAHRFELPAFQTLDRLVRHLRYRVHQDLYARITATLSPAEQGRLEALLHVQDGHSAFTQLKDTPRRATLSHLRQWTTRLTWLDGLFTPQPFLHDLAYTKVHQFAAEAAALEVGDLRAIRDTPRRLSLLLCLLYRAQVQTRDQLAEMLLKRMRATTNAAKARLQELHDQHRELEEQMLAVFSEVLTHTLETSEEEEATLGHQVRHVLHTHGGAAALQERYEQVAAYHNDNYRPLMWGFFRPYRAALFQVSRLLTFRSATQDQSLLDALRFIHQYQHTRGSTVPNAIALDFASTRWQALIRTRWQRETVLQRRPLEVCVFFYLDHGLRCGDVYIEGSEAHADYRQQLLPWDACVPRLPAYCQALQLAPTAAAFVATLRERLRATAARVDATYPANTALTIDAEGTPHLKRLPAAPVPEGFPALEALLKARLPERHLLDVLKNVQAWVGYTRHFGPPSGADAKLAEPVMRYLFTVFSYACELGATQMARHANGLVSRYILRRLNAQHITAPKLEAALRDVIAAYTRFELPQLWGSGHAAIADGTHIALRENNLLGAQHIRYGSFGGIAYHHISDTYRTWKVSCNLLNLRKQFAEGFFRAIFISP
jgi:hypothetical protein